MRPHFTLTVVASANGFIARHPEDAPHLWASPEEQALFFADVEAADWGVMGRRTHEAADRPDRRRIVFSSAGGGWKRPAQLWVDPADLTPADLAALVAKVRPLERGIVLGGTHVHDWFLDRGAIDRVHLTVEPVRFGGGLPIITGQTERDPVAAFRAAGFAPVEERALNAGGTRFLVLEPGRGGGQDDPAPAGGDDP